MKCCVEPGKRKVRRKPLSELYVNRNFTENREEWQKELQRHCEEVYTETKEWQENRIEYFKKKGDQQFTEDGRNAEIVVDLVLEARAKMCDNKVNGFEDAVVSEKMIKQVPLEKIYIEFRSVFKDASWVIWRRQGGLLAETGCRAKERDQKLQGRCAHISVFEAVCIVHSSIGTREGTRKLEETACGWLEWNRLPTPASNGNKSATKALGMAGGQNSHVEAWQCSAPHHVLGQHGHQGSLDEARPNHVSKIMENHDTRGWLIAALLREMGGLEGNAMFACVESNFSFYRCLRQGSVEAPDCGKRWPRSCWQMLRKIG